MGNTGTAGRQQRRRQQPVGAQQPATQHTSKDRWPARPGQPQYSWEEPRTIGYINRLPSSIRAMWSACRKDFAQMLGEKIWEETDFRIKAATESSMGGAVNGYNFREDILRALGNAVVEQTAEKAFLYLLNKHYGISAGT